jgi:hypothetical protein
MTAPVVYLPHFYVAYLIVEHIYTVYFSMGLCMIADR